MSIWALCGQCDEWFECPDWYDRGALHPVCPGCGAEPVVELRRGGEQPGGMSVSEVVSVLQGAALALGSAHGLIPAQPASAQQRLEAVIDTLDGVIVELRHATRVMAAPAPEARPARVSVSP